MQLMCQHFVLKMLYVTLVLRTDFPLAGLFCFFSAIFVILECWQLQCAMHCRMCCLLCCVCLESIRIVSCNGINFDLYFYNRKLIQ